MFRLHAANFLQLKMKYTCATVILMLASIMPFSAVAGEKAKPDSNRSTEVKKLSFEQQRDAAIQQITEFEKKVREIDPKAAPKLRRLRYAMPEVANTFPPEQWRKQVEFLYLSITMIDEMSSLDDPDSILSKYFSDEEKRAPNDITKAQFNERQALLDRRFDELQKMLESGSIDLTEHAARALAVALIYYPNDRQFIALRRYKLDLAMQLKQGVIDQAKFDMLWSIRRNAYNDNRAQQQTEEQAARDRQEWEESRQRWSNALGGIADGIRSSRPAPSVNCTTTALGGTVYTNCR